MAVLQVLTLLDATMDVYGKLNRLDRKLLSCTEPRDRTVILLVSTFIADSSLY